MNEHGCPICNLPMENNPRYPRAVCSECVSQVRDETGRQIEFFNTSLSGGITGRYIDDGRDYPASDCYINGIHCRAMEAHMGGIVIEVV